MKAPENYTGPLSLEVPPGYFDVTCLSDSKRHGIPCPEHPYYAARDKIAAILQSELGIEMTPAISAADKIMEAL